MRGAASRAARRVAIVAGSLLIALVTFWMAVALHYEAPPLAIVHVVAPWGAVLAGTLALVFFVRERTRRRAAIAFAALWVLALLWWSTIEPSNERRWRPEVSRLAWASFEESGDDERVTLHEIRNFDYRSERDFTPAWYDRTFRLADLDQVDLIASYWMGPAIAHLFVSFGFGDEHVAMSVEARPEEGEGYSMVGGSFKQFEIYYVVADERDAIRVRTNYRKDPPEQVYLYRMRGSAAARRALFLDYAADLNSLKERPRFYGALSDNCTTTIRWNARALEQRLPWSWQFLLTGHTPAYLGEHGRFDSSLPFEELERRSQINEAARAADAAPDFSRRIRAGLPPRDGR